jgi:hypothetical protein
MSLGLLDLAIAGIPALAFGIWQLISINKEIARDRQKREEAEQSASPEGSGHPVGEHRLDDR